MSCLEIAPSVESQLEEEGEEMMDDEDEEEEEEGEDEEDDVEEEEEDEEGDHSEVTVGRRSGRGLTLKTLLKEGVLEPGEGNMTINYLGNKFKGDLLPDGRIRSQETSKVFGTPSAWAIYCKKIVNPDKKSGCGWASVRYRGKKLDAYKNNWYRQKRLEYEKEEEEMEEEESGCESEEASPHEQEIIEFDILGSRNPNHDPSTMIELCTFQSIGRMQPFNITMSSSAMAVIDVHGHLTTSEVVGYLAGQWDVNNHNLIVSHAFPVRCRLGDPEKGPSVEQELYGEMSRLKLSLVGWYHTHPSAPPLPTLRDIDSQLDYEMKMKGYNDASYTPVLGIIVSPYQKAPVHESGIPHPNGNATGFWVMPPPENKPLEYGRPMSMQFTVVQDAFIPKEALLHMSEVVKYYKEAPDAVQLTDIFEDKFAYWHKLKNSLRNRVPKDHFQPLIEFLTKVIDKKLPEDDPTPPPPPNPPPTTTTTTAATSLPPSVAASNLPSSTSISLVEAKEPSTAELLPSTKDLESCVSNLLKATMSSGAITLSELSKERSEQGRLSTVSPSVGPDDQPSSIRPKSAEGRTPPPKSYSPLFQLPLPPLFSIDSGGSKLPPKDKLPHFSLADEKRPSGDIASGSKIRSSNKIDESIHIGASAGTSKKEGVDIVPPGSYLDLSMLGTKEGTESKGKKISSVEDLKKDHSKIGGATIDVPAWFAQAKLMQEAFALPPHERDNPFTRAPSPRDVAHLFSSEFLSPHWNPTLKGFPPSLAFSTDSKPTYHSDVPLLLKKQKQDTSHDSKEDSGRDSSRDFRPPPDYKEAVKEVRDRSRDLRGYLQEEKNFKDPRVFKGETSDLFLKETRDLHETHRRDFWEIKDPAFESIDAEETPRDHSSQRDPRDLRDVPKDIRDTPRDLRDIPREMRDISRDLRDVQREIRDLPRDLRDPKDRHRESGEVKERERRDAMEFRDMRGPRDIRDPRGEGASLHGGREDARDMSEGGNTKEGQPFRSLPPLSAAPMDMSTFKIKRDLQNPDGPGRHFIEPTGIKRHPPLLHAPAELLTVGSEGGRAAIDFTDGKDPTRSPKDTVINLACGNMDTSLQPERMETTFIPPRTSDLNDPRETTEGKEHLKEPIHKALINLRDPKSLLERDDRPFTMGTTSRHIFTPTEDATDGKETALSLYRPHRTPSIEESMDYE